MAYSRKYELKRVTNGWIFKELDEESGQEIVGEEKEDEAESFKDFLQSIDEYFGPTSDKYDKKRICIFCKPGINYEGPLEKEYLESLRWLYKELGGILKRCKDQKREL